MEKPARGCRNFKVFYQGDSCRGCKDQTITASGEGWSGKQPGPRGSYAPFVALHHLYVIPHSALGPFALLFLYAGLALVLLLFSQFPGLQVKAEWSWSTLVQSMLVSRMHNSSEEDLLETCARLFPSLSTFPCAKPASSREPSRQSSRPQCSVLLRCMPKT